MPSLLLFWDEKTGWLRSVFCEHKNRRRRANAPTYGVAARHAMFGDLLTAVIRYNIYRQAVPCAVCGKKRKRHWSMCVPFRAWDVDALENHMVIDTSRGPVLAPLTPVCQRHPLHPELEAADEFARALQYYIELQKQPPPKPPKQKPATHKS